MASRTRIRQGITLEEFLELPDNDDLEYIEGRIEKKVSPQKSHAEITGQLWNCLNAFAAPRKLGRAYIELRCTFAGRSIVPDVVLLLKQHIEIDADGEPVDETWWPPDLHVEIISPKQSVKASREKLAHSTSNGCPLGWLINPEARPRYIDVYRPGRPAERMPADGVLDGDPVLPGFRLPVTEVFGWLKLSL
jgi:Uma2 family endonuclease